MTTDTYSHIVSGLQEMAARRIEGAIGDEALKILGDDIAGDSMSADVGKMVGNCTSSAEIKQLSTNRNLWINLDYIE